MNLRIIYLRARQRAQVLSEAEEAELLSLLADPLNQPQIEDLMAELWNEPESTAPIFEEAEHQTMLKNILSAGQTSIAEAPETPRIQPLWATAWFRISAAIILISISAAFFLYLSDSNHQKELAMVAAVSPGSDKAFLTLADGTRFSLADIQEVDETRYSANGISKSGDGFLIYKPVKRQLGAYAHGTNILSTPKGGQYKIILPDGTRVWMNAASTLKFPVAFDLDSRTVELLGEAYFEVAKDKSKPFLVRSRNQLVEVFGTHFNVNSYAEEINIVTTLLEGSVAVKDLKTGLHLMLKPGQQAILNKDLSLATVQVDEAVAWKDGYFLFEHEELSSIMRKLSRWYDIKTEIQNEDLETLRFAGTVNRFQNLDDVLKMLELTGDVKFKIEGRTVTAYK